MGNGREKPPVALACGYKTTSTKSRHHCHSSFSRPLPGMATGGHTEEHRPTKRKRTEPFCPIPRGSSRANSPDTTSGISPEFIPVTRRAQRSLGQRHRRRLELALPPPASTPGPVPTAVCGRVGFFKAIPARLWRHIPAVPQRRRQQHPRVPADKVRTSRSLF